MQNLINDLAKHSEASDNLKFFEMDLPEIDKALDVVQHPSTANSKEELEADKLIVEHASKTMLE